MATAPARAGQQAGRIALACNYGEGDGRCCAKVSTAAMRRTRLIASCRMTDVAEDSGSQCEQRLKRQGLSVSESTRARIDHPGETKQGKNPERTHNEKCGHHVTTCDEA
ncbi:hypothetical protein [Paraburkholderia sp.]|uniref:hypothetical protein n=1 Tax=Paraburkholderia sp. TaxID=1926495 RepID=UPI0025EF8E89|nr:hypothetical protein [Paraburkholderia sp.]